MATFFHNCTKLEKWGEPINELTDLTSSNGREVMEELASAMSKLAKSLAGVLVESLGHRKELLDNICDESTCFLRLNHYPICPFSGEISGLVPHTDSDFLTILHQDCGGGLQLMKGSQWVAVKPNPEALVVNIGDLLQVHTPNSFALVCRWEWKIDKFGLSRKVRSNSSLKFHK